MMRDTGGPVQTVTIGRVMARKDAEIHRLRAEVERLRSENERLREELALMKAGFEVAWTSMGSKP